ncbi:baseplate J/gp47 family protein [Clostridium tetani]|uniref:baseplate J/gp47 family protein n=1 Tax=Clostridium tetani TaxID=1513 RepID=UPI001FB19374|nr:baseplate J/gp47 family protein [Clostridium tetani]
MYKENADDILKRMKSYVENDVSTMEGTLLHDALAPTAYELEDTKEDLEEILNKVFVQNAYKNGYSEELELRCAEHGVYRKKGKLATGTITIEGVKETEITKGTIVQTKLNLQYKTLEDVKISENGTVDIPIIALEEGTEYNVKANTIVEMPIALVGIDKIYNKENIVNGRDTEDDKSLYNRFLIKVQTPSTSGNIYDYINWSLEVNGVGNCIVKPLWNGKGTVKVILVNSSGRCPSIEIIKNVKENIEKKRPIGADVTVVGVNETNLNIECKLLISKEINIEDVKKEIIKNMQEYLTNISLKSNVVRYNKIANCILNIDTIIDYRELKINNFNTDIKLEEDTIAILESVVVDSAT